MGQREYVSWPTDAKIPLFLTITGTSGTGITGASPEVAIRRYRETHGVTLDGSAVSVQTNDLDALGTVLPTIARDLDVRVTEFRPEDESLESVFRYLVGRR